MRSCANFTLKMYLKMCTEALEKNIHSTLLTEMEEFSNHLTYSFAHFGICDQRRCVQTHWGH